MTRQTHTAEVLQYEAEVIRIIRSESKINSDLKMILSRILKSVSVNRNYEIEIDFTVDFEKIGGVAHLGASDPISVEFTPATLKKVV